MDDTHNDTSFGTQEQLMRVLSDSIGTLSVTYGLSELSSQEHAEAIDALTAMVINEVFARLLEEMSEEDVAAFAAFLETNPTEERMMHYLAEKHPRVADTVEEVAHDILAEGELALEGLDAVFEKKV